MSSVTWHRTSAWTDELVAQQLEFNSLLLPLRPLLKNKDTDTDRVQATQPASDQSVSIAILRMNQQVGSELIQQLAAIQLTPALTSLEKDTTQVVFLSQDELDPIMQSLIQSKLVKAEDLFWIVPAQRDATGRRSERNATSAGASLSRFSAAPKKCKDGRSHGQRCEAFSPSPPLILPVFLLFYCLIEHPVATQTESD